MIIEKLKYEDLNSYKKLIDQAFDNSNNINDYKKYNSNNINYEIIVMKDNNKIVGSITMYKINLFTFDFQPMLELFNVAVLKEYKHKHIATKLFDYIKEYAKNNGYKSIYLTCYSDELPACSLYESVGMNKMNSTKYKIDL